MRIAVPSTSDGRFNQHFGQTRVFEIFDIDERAAHIRQRHRLGIPDGGGCGAIPVLLAREGVMKVIAGGMGAGAAANLRQCGIEAIVGAAGDDPRQVVFDYLAGTLALTSQPCDGHGHRHPRDDFDAHGSCCMPAREAP